MRKTGGKVRISSVSNEAADGWTSPIDGRDSGYRLALGWSLRVERDVRVNFQLMVTGLPFIFRSQALVCLCSFLSDGTLLRPKH
ncbi:MAG: hypothetical protein ABSC48_04285 [Terracidiphilus sp.]|jgi:hypothetical protein